MCDKDYFFHLNSKIRIQHKISDDFTRFFIRGIRAELDISNRNERRAESIS